jgi:hypothetical protein
MKHVHIFNSLCVFLQEQNRQLPKHPVPSRYTNVCTEKNSWTHIFGTSHHLLHHSQIVRVQRDLKFSYHCIIIFWDVMSHSLVNRYRNFGGITFLRTPAEWMLYDHMETLHPPTRLECHSSRDLNVCTAAFCRWEMKNTNPHDNCTKCCLLRLSRQILKTAHDSFHSGATR